MLDDDLRRRLTARFGPAAAAWLDALPARAAELAARWGVELDGGAPLAGGGTSVVLRGRRGGDLRGDDGSGDAGFGTGGDTDGADYGMGGGDRDMDADGTSGAVVMKLTVEPALGRDEAAALQAWSGGPVPLLLAHDAASGALLLEAIAPGRPLADSPAPPSTSAVARLLRALAVPVPASAPSAAPRPWDAPALPRRSWSAASPPAPTLPPLRERVDVCFELWLRRRAASPVARATVPAGALERGHALARELADDPAAPRALVHGDLHPGNVLDGGLARGLVAIDPRACVGDPGFDAVDLTLWGVDTPAAAHARVAAVAALSGQDQERLERWCAALAAMAAASLASRPRPGTAQRIETLLALAV